MKILHTSDWHLGRSLYGRKRVREHALFLDWLIETITMEKVDVLLIAGDIFDTTTPGNRTQELYYQFLRRVADSPCRHVVAIAGNHDSPSFLNASRDLLSILNIHVFGAAAADPSEEVLLLKNSIGAPELIVCAVPFLKDQDIRTASAGESIADKERNLVEGIQTHYARVFQAAEMKKSELPADVPIVAMGHMFTAGGRTADGDGVRDLYIGSLAHVPSGVFPQSIDYVALGHLHVPQQVDGNDRIRYSGSPLPMGFAEGGHIKSIAMVDLNNSTPGIQVIEIPAFQKLERISGSWSRISERLLELKTARVDVWVEVVYEGIEIISDLRNRLDSLTTGTRLEILRVKNARVTERAMAVSIQGETLDDLHQNEVFDRCLTANNIPEPQRSELILSYREILGSFNEDDPGADD